MRTETLAGVEGALQTLAYVLPGRFADAEVVAECVRSSLALLRLLTPHPPKSDGSIGGGDLSSARLQSYAAYVRRTSPLAGYALTALEVCRAVQVPVELLVSRLVALPVRLRGLAAYELAKAAARLYVLWRGGFRPVLRSYTPDAVVNTDNSSDDVLGRIAPSGSKDSDVLGDAALDAYVLAPELAVRSLKGRLARAREVARILRPAVYVLGLAGACGRRGSRVRWLAWALGVILDVFAEWESVCAVLRSTLPSAVFMPRALRSSVADGEKEHLLPKADSATPMEADERTARLAALVLHALRMPLHAAATGPCISGIAAVLDAIVVTRPLASTLRSYDRLIRESVLYTLNS